MVVMKNSSAGNPGVDIEGNEFITVLEEEILPGYTKASAAAVATTDRTGIDRRMSAIMMAEPVLG